MKRLIFIYNADSGLMNGMFDFFHKMVKPETYSCSLCMITHNNVGKRKDWRLYLESLTIKTDFLHRDEFLKKFPKYSASELPIIFLQEINSELTTIVSAIELNQFDLPELTKQINERLNS